MAINQNAAISNTPNLPTQSPADGNRLGDNLDPRWSNFSVTCLQWRGARIHEGFPPRFPPTWEARLRIHFPRCLLVGDPGEVFLCLRGRSEPPPPRPVLGAPRSPPPPHAPQTSPCTRAAPQRRRRLHFLHSSPVLSRSRPVRPTFPLGLDNFAEQAHSAKKQLLQLLRLHQEFQNQTWQ